MTSVTHGRIRGLYGITPDEADTARLVALVRAACVGGMRILQLRNKVAGVELREAQARAPRSSSRSAQRRVRF